MHVSVLLKISTSLILYLMPPMINLVLHAGAEDAQVDEKESKDTNEAFPGSFRLGVLRCEGES